MNRYDETAPILVLGGTGKTGQRVVRRLIEQGQPVRIGSREAALPFDWDAPETWAPVVEGTRAIYIAYHPDLAVPGALKTVGDFVETALRAGVKRMVLLSGRGEEEAEQTEQMLISSGADWTIVRASWFFQNFSETFLADAINTGEVALPIGDVKEPFIDVEDIADVAAAALTDPAHIGKLYEVTGPELLNFSEAVASIAAASGRPIRYRQIPAADYKAAMEQAGVPEDMISLVLYLFTNVLDGRNANVTDGVSQALGRPPRRFTDYAKRTSLTGIWGAQTAALA
ncbi:NAD(P)H-binding protein [Nisaea sp.]|uniref:NmrA family NAD(P)-binding protein n=1 Tax=Nisaea sp. TaxID=2024842 RepID=UPI002B267D75|nr:NAD(P)H-binding protein [Nisaea sp.]